MPDPFAINTANFCWATGIENTFIPQTRPGLRALDEYALTQHYKQWGTDVDLAAETGVRALRWGIPWYRVQPAPDRWDWRWTDEVLDTLVNVKGLTPILDLMHYGTPIWLDNSFINARYPHHVAGYARAVAARYKSLVRYYTPLNEPTINAHMCGRTGEWPPYLHGDDASAKGVENLRRWLRLPASIFDSAMADFSYLNPIHPRPCPDPFVPKYCGGYWGYCTGFWHEGRCFGVLHSDDLVCRRQNERISIQWESQVLGAVDAPGESARVGLGVQEGRAVFDMVRVTAIGGNY